jgi:hypothetical protein
MNTLRGWIATTFLITTIAIANVPARAGIIVGNLTSQNPAPCSDVDVKVTIDSTAKSLTGILVGNLGGIIVGNFGGILVGNLGGIIVGNTSDNPTNCGILVGN